MSAEPAMPNSVCPQCGTGFRCGMEGGDVDCWCAALPPLLPVPAKPGFGAALPACLCPECLSARLGDILSMLYLCSATLKRFEDDGRPAADLPLLHWSMQDALYRLQQAFDEFLTNFPGHIALIWALKALVFPLGKRCKPPTDVLAHEVARLMMEPGAVRDRLTSGIFVPTADGEPMADLEHALQCVIQCSAIEAKLREAVKQHKITDHGDGQIAQALQLNIISAEEAGLLNKLKDLRGRVVKVDDFPPDFGHETRTDTGIAGTIGHVASAAAGAAGFVAAVSAAAAAAAEGMERISSDGGGGEEEQDRE